jgi:ribosome biogenesis GTPase
MQQPSPDDPLMADQQLPSTDQHPDGRAHIADQQSAGQARILKGVGGQYWLHGPSGFTGIASARGIFRKDGIVPTAGDLVTYAASGDPDNPWRIDSILPRHNILIRPAIANLDILIITLSAEEPAPDYYLVDKLLTVCLANQIKPLICITKTDLVASTADAVARTYRPVGCPVILTNPTDTASHEQLRQLLTGHIVSFAGQSGVGKSTLLNQLFGATRMATGGVSERIGRGKHTTRHVELFPFAGGYLADTPGFSSFELSELGITGANLVTGYPEIAAIADRCRFTGCRHLGDLGCAIDQADIDPDRLARYRFFRVQLDSVDPYATGRRRLPRKP